MFDDSRKDYQRLVLLVVALGYFLMQIGMVQITAVLPTIASSFGVDTNLGSWVLTAYLLCLSGWALAAGRFGDLFGHKRVFAIGLGIFGVSVLLGGAAPTIEFLIACRALQGVGGAMMLGNGFPIVTRAFPRQFHGRAIGTIGTSASIGGMIGVMIGSAFVESIGWRWLFWMIIPVAVVASYSALKLARTEEHPKVSGSRADLGGVLFLFLTITAISLSVSHLHDGPETFEAGWPYHSVMQVVAVALFLLFVRQERRAAQPLVSFRHFHNGAFSTAIGTNFILHFTMLGPSFMMPYVVERGLNLSPAYTGLVIAASQLAIFSTSFLAGWVYDRTRSVLLRPVGLAMIGAGLIFLAAFGPQLPFLGFVLVGSFLGGGLGFVNTVNNTVAMGSVDADQRGFAAGMIETSRQIGHTMAIAVVSAMIVIGNPDGVLGGTTPMSFTGFQIGWLVMGSVALAGVLLSWPRARRFPHPLPPLPGVGEGGFGGGHPHTPVSQGG